MEHLSEIKNLLLILALIIGAVIALFFHFKLAPVIKITTTSKRLNSETSLLAIKIENISKVRVTVNKNIENLVSSNILLQYFQHDQNKVNELTEFLPFSKKWFDKKGYPSTWKEPEIIFETTEWIYPGEVITIERPIPHSENKVLHIGVQVHAKFGLFELATLRNFSQRWTSVCFLV